MRRIKWICRRESGFTMVELMIGIAIIAILGAIAVPAVLNWLPDYRLKKAARDLYGNLQLAKKTAARINDNCAVVFDTGVVPGMYYICTDDGGDGWDGPAAMGGNDTTIKGVPLVGYGSNIDYGFANATDDMQGSGAAPLGNVTYGGAPLCAVFNPRGMSDIQAQGNVAEGYVYLQNNSTSPVGSRATFGVGGPASGVIRLRKWYPQSGAWQ